MRGYGKERMAILYIILTLTLTLTLTWGLIVDNAERISRGNNSVVYVSVHLSISVSAFLRIERVQ